MKQNPAYCLDINDYGTTPGSQVWLYSCHTGDKTPSHQNQEWNYDANRIVSRLSGLCITASGDFIGSETVLQNCDGTTGQQWVYNNTDFSLRQKKTGKCLDAGSSVRTCDFELNKNSPFCNPQLPLATRVADLISRMTIQEKLGLFGTSANPVGRLMIPAYQWWSEALHGVAGSSGVKFEAPTPVATSFPQVCLTGATWNRTLFSEIANAIGNEARAFANVGHAGLTFWAPNTNIFRDPRWGRGQETVGEDPLLTGTYVSLFSQGLQGPDPAHMKVSSCCKHFAAYSLENWEGMDRYHFNAIVDQQDLVDTYFPAFQACVEVGKVSSIMCSYNAVNGVPSCADSDLLTVMARNRWGFDGYITSDCGAVDNVLHTHNFTSTTDETCQVVLDAGMDINCGSFLPEYLPQAVTNGYVSKEKLDTALTHLFSVQFRLGMFDPISDQPYGNISIKYINSPEHQFLALDAARQGIVLLKNEKNVLPLTNAVKSIAVLGPNADATYTLQGNYYGNAPYLVSPIQGLTSYAKVNFAHGCDIDSNVTAGFADACTAAGQSDVTVLVMGLDQSQEAEGLDRTILSFPGVQQLFIQQMIRCSKGDVILAVMSGGPVDLTSVKMSSGIKAIVWVGYPGQSGGQALADVLFGEYNVAGRLSYTMYSESLIDAVSMEDMAMRPNATTGNPGRGYRYYTGEPVYPFGHGLSYTTWAYRSSSASVTSLNADSIEMAVTLPEYSPFSAPPIATVKVEVQNTGKRDSDRVILAFISGPNAGQDGHPIKRVIGFDRVHVKQGSSKTVTFNAKADDFSYTDAYGFRHVQPGRWTIDVEGVQFPINVTN
eukprot:TRINITY_DN3096_c0_g1_i1.p1 TRINITY_DN3096_c0_g1~~TRINITY_DN3096_c0_g1_i1.p1  ORF type:complete len:878 (-),score=229.77 TRINITY_DN3096_c0_g1_i1:40-2523(-)